MSGDVTGDCWLWQGTIRLDGRPMVGNGLYAYRVIYEAVIGSPVPTDGVLHHLCGVPECVNPFHLSPLSRADHLDEHRPLMRVTCRNGHTLGGENLYMWRGKRYCRACHRNNSRKQRAANPRAAAGGARDG